MISLPSETQNYIHVSKYSRWMNDLNRRENYSETVNRYIDFINEKVKSQSGEYLNPELKRELKDSILYQKSMPSMRAMMTAGEAATRDNASIYNCSYVAINDVNAFSEIMFLLMCGTGVGFSCERPQIKKLPNLPRAFSKVPRTIIFEDSKLGWKEGFQNFINSLYAGEVPDLDLSLIRSAGARLKVFGGRASGPEPLQNLLHHTSAIFQSAEGTQLNSLEVHSIVCKIAEAVISGGVRRSALISLSNPSDDRMRKAKQGQWWLTNPHFALANNSAAWTEKPEMSQFFDEWKGLYESKSGERGIYNREAAVAQAEKYGRRDTNYEFGINPCLTADTMVAVADGRGMVAIGELASTGIDVPVYTMNEKGNPVIRWMRNPHKTGNQVPILAVTFDDGLVVKSTGNHKFNLTDGSYKEAIELTEGDSVCSFTRSRASFKDMIPDSNVSSNQDYWWLRTGRFKSLEHRNIANFFAENKMGRDDVVHHEDYNGLNNEINNLTIMNRTAHNELHKKDMLGDKNPMRDGWFNKLSEEDKANHRAKYSKKGMINSNANPATNEEIREAAKRLVSLLGRSFTLQEWTQFAKQNGYPVCLQDYRCKTMNIPGGVRQLSEETARDLDLPYLSPQSRSEVFVRNVEFYRQAIAGDYEMVRISNEYYPYVTRTCEDCSSKYERPWETRQVAFCIECHRKRQFSDSFAKSTDRKLSDLTDTILQNFNNYVYENKSEPSISQFREYLKEKTGKEFRYNCMKGKITDWKHLKELAKTVNHKVVSVELIGFEDVYNGTVDEFHNFYVGGNLKNSEFGKEEYSFVNVRNCAEVIMRDCGFCNLSEIVCRFDDTLSSLKTKAKSAIIFGSIQACFTDFPHLRPEWKKNAEEERLLGVSLTGIMDCPLLNGQPTEKGQTRRNARQARNAILTELKSYALEVCEEWANILNINLSVAITVVKPSGTVSQLVNCSSGIHPRYSQYFIRTYRENTQSPICQFMKEAGIPWEPSYTNPDYECVFSFPVKAPDNCITRHDLSALEQLENWLDFKRNWTEHSVSCTIYVREEEWLEVGAWVYRYFDEITGLSFLPFDNGTYAQAPYTEITKEEYEIAISKMPEVNWAALSLYESEDTTVSMQELACVGGSCEI